jgi:hypothetical protein
MSVKVQAADAAKNWETGFGQAGPKYTAGVQAVKTAPGQLAAAQQDVWAQNTVAAKPRYASRVASVTLQQWQQAAVTTGAARLQTGATKGAPKMQAFMQSFIPKLTAVVDSLPARGTFEQNMAKSYAYAQALHNLKGQI